MRSFILGLTLILTAGAVSAAKPKSEFGFDASLAIMSMPFPMGKGISVYYQPNPYYSLSFMYQTSGIALDLFSFHLASIDEDDYFIKARYFPGGKSFNFAFGGGKRQLTAKFSKDLFDLVLFGPSETASEINTNFLHVGLGNRWHWKNR